MEDVELRFVERTEEVQGCGDAPSTRRVRILQYRKKKYLVSGGGMRFFEWDEWTDVPLVAEDDA